MFNLKIKTDTKLTLTTGSMALFFLEDGKNIKAELELLKKQYALSITPIQVKSFLSKKGDEITTHKNEGKPDIAVIKKVKIDESFSVDYFRNFLAGFLSSVENKGIKTLNIVIPDFAPYKKYFSDESYFIQSIIEGIYYGNYSFDKYKTEEKENAQLEVLIYSKDKKAANEALTYTGNIMKGVQFTRDLQNEPAMYLPPVELALRIKQHLTKEKVKVTVFDEKEIMKRKMGGVLAVGSGSSNPPRFIIMEYKPAVKSKTKLKRIALVGKGVTFDSGGISIKPATDMWEMKADMSGAAVVAGTILAAAASKLQIEIIGVIPAVENMPSGSAFKPGDIVKTASGKTVEVDNTDAEGRVILTDALDYASKLKPDAIIDLATLTGAVVVALGEFVAGLFTKDEQLAESIYKSGLKTYDRVWRLPLWDDFAKLNKSEVADVKNIGGRWGGAISAAKFLEVFVDKNIPWAHIDIAGPAVVNSHNNYTKTYMTGFGVRLIFDFLLNSVKKG